MRKIVPILGFVLALALSACQATQSLPSAASTSPSGIAAAPVAASPATASPSSAPTASAGQQSPIGQAAPPGCTVVSRDPTPGPTEASIFPLVTEKDWVQGPMTATATILEYSDFQ